MPNSILYPDEVEALAKQIRAASTDDEIQKVLEVERKCLALIEEAITVCDTCEYVESSYLESAAEIPRASIAIFTAASDL